tara:strand:- start:3178 stop:4029 length:852 start_codon:yes stop_codon:yes gene_type:complete
MKPIIKYQGGKTRELPTIRGLLPDKYDTVLEPFAGGAAVSFDLGHRSILNDFNPALINMYRAIKNPIMFQEVYAHVCYLKTLEHDELEKHYYESRSYINSGQTDPYEWAVSYITMKQLAFSGMERYNSKGQFNVPFGHYKKFACNLHWNHMKFLGGCDIHCGDFESIFGLATKNDFIFIDPPYIDRLGYTDGDGGDDLHQRLVKCMHNTKAKWMFVHSDNDYYKRELAQYNIILKPFGYGQRFGKNKNHANASVKHMYVTNYKNNMTDHLVAVPSLQHLLEVV